MSSSASAMIEEPLRKHEERPQHARSYSRQSIESALQETRKSLEALNVRHAIPQEPAVRAAPFYQSDPEPYEPHPDDWAIYNSFNNPGAASLSALPAVPSPASSSHLYDTSAGYFEATPRQNKTVANTRTPRKSLLSPEQFGFDVQNSVPQRRTDVAPSRQSMLGALGSTPSRARNPTTKSFASSDEGMDILRDEKRKSTLSTLSRRLDEDPFGRFGSEYGYGGARASTLGRLDDEQEHLNGDNNIEIITVPALGKEFSARELKEMKRTHRRKVRAEARKRAMARFARGDVKWCGRLVDNRVLLFLIFGFLAALGLTLFFVIPRFPTFELLVNKPIERDPSGRDMQTHHFPTNFSMDILVNLRADNTAGFLPTKSKNLKMEVVDMSTHRKVGTGNLPNYEFPGHKMKVFQMPVHIAYASYNASGDPTWTHWVNACGPKYPGTPREALDLRFSLEMDIKGLIGKRGTAVQLSNIECPFELQADET